MTCCRGGLFAGVVLFLLQELSAYIISGHLRHAQSTYGHFATVITILWWFYLQSIVTLLGAQLNVVLKERLYPRSLDRRAADRGRPSACSRRTPPSAPISPQEKVTARVSSADAGGDGERSAQAVR